MRAIIDADSLIWVTAYNLKDSDPDDPLDQITGKQMIDQEITDILLEVGATWYIGFMGGKSRTFRHTDIKGTKPYKGNRPDKPEFMEKWETVLKEHLNKNHCIHYCEGIEADDAVSICMSLFKDSILCGIDKDLRQIPGKHFNYQRDKWYMFEVSEEEAITNLNIQLLVGDSSDNIPGLEGVGEVKAKKILNIDSEGNSTIPHKLMKYAVLDAYIKKHGEYEGTVRYYNNFMLVKMLTPDQAHKHGFNIPRPDMFKKFEYTPTEKPKNPTYSMYSERHVEPDDDLWESVRKQLN